MGKGQWRKSSDCGPKQRPYQKQQAAAEAKDRKQLNGEWEIGKWKKGKRKMGNGKRKVTEALALQLGKSSDTPHEIKAPQAEPLFFIVPSLR